MNPERIAFLESIRSTGAMQCEVNLFSHDKASRKNWRKAKEVIALEAIAHADNWITSQQLAGRMGMFDKWRIVACALRRLEKQGKVQLKVEKEPGKARLTEDVVYYRIPGVSVGLFASWLRPQVPKFEKMQVRIVRLLKD